MDTGAISTDCLKHLAWVQFISRCKGLALTSQEGWVGPRGSTGHPQILQQQGCQHTGAFLDAFQAMEKGALRTVAPLLTVLREAGHLAHDVSTREGAPIAGLAFTV